MISAVVLTKNEEKSIASCLKSLIWCDEIVLVDDYSKDKTASLAKKHKARVYKRGLKGDFAKQRNFGLNKARADWVLFLDADEKISSELRKEIQLVLKQPDLKVNGFWFKRKDKFLGKWLRFGETSRVRLLRLARKKAGKWKGPVHEVWQIKGRKAVFKNPIIHQRSLKVGEFLKRLNTYSSLRAGELYEKRVKSNWFFIIAYPTAKFLQNYVLRLGFLDARQGLIMAVMMSLHSFFVRAKLYLLWQNKGVEEIKIPALNKIYEKYG